MTGREVCIKNDWRVGDVLESKFGSRVVITAIGVDLILIYRPTFGSEMHTRLDDVDAGWKLVYRPRKLVGYRVKLQSTGEYVDNGGYGGIEYEGYGTTNWREYSAVFENKELAKDAIKVFEEGKLIAVYKVAKRKTKGK